MRRVDPAGHPKCPFYSQKVLPELLRVRGAKGFLFMYRFWVWPLLAILLISCQPGTTTLPTRALLAATSVPTRTAAPDLFSTAIPTNAPTATINPTSTPPPAQIAQITVVTAGASPVITPTQPASATPLPPIFVFGRSAAGRDLLGYRYGFGSQVVMLVGGIHAGYEANTIRLLEELQTHFSENLGDIQPEITLIFVPALNVDGVEYGRTLRGRYNGNGVDLNRNWGCGWSEEAFFQNDTVNPGAEPFSEPETRALGSLIERTRPAAVIFYHAAANGVFAGDCPEGNTISADLGLLYGQASGYPSGGVFSEYVVTGSAPAWVSSLGIPALDVELATADSTEFTRNLNAILAVQRWLINRLPQ